jgi:ABC-type amino acid transport substrate-binding protein
MLIRRTAITAAAVLVATFALAACASSGGTPTKPVEGTLTVGSDLTYPPYDFLTAATPSGFDPDFVRALAKQMNMKVSFQDTRFEQLIAGIKSDRYQVIASALYITKDRASQVDYIPYFATGNSIVVQKGSKGVSTALDLCGKSVSAIKGGAIVTSLRGDASAACTSAGKPAITVLEFETDPEATQALISGQVNAQITDAAVASTLAKKTEGAVEVSSKQLLYPIQVGLAVRKGNTTLAKKITAAFAVMKSNGTYQALLTKYNLAAYDQAAVDSILGN